MTHSESALRALFVHLLYTRLRMVLISLVIVLSTLIALGLMYFRLQSISAGFLADRLLPAPMPPEPLSTLVLQMAEDLRQLFLGEVRIYCLSAILFLAVLFVSMDVIMLVSSLFIEGCLLPRSEWAWTYLEQQKDYERTVFKPLMLLGPILFLGLGWWAKESVWEVVPDDYLVSFASNLVVFMSAVVLAVDYWIQVKWGFLRYLASAPRFTELLRVLVARFLVIATVFILLFVTLTVIQQFFVPLLVRQMETSEVTMVSRVAAFRKEAAAALVAQDSIESVTSSVNDILRKWRAVNEEVPQFVSKLFDDGIKPAVGVLVFLVFLTAVYFPLVYAEVRVAPLAVGLIVLSLIGIDLGLRGVMPKIFRLGDHGPTALVGMVALIIIVGDTISEVVKRVFHKNVECWGEDCRTANVWGAKFCVTCGRPLVSGLSSRPAYLGNEQTRRIHASSLCPYVRRMRKRHLVGFRTIEEADQQGYRRCAFCLKDV